MKFSVACQKALAAQKTEVFIFKPSAAGCRDNGPVEINQMAVVLDIALHGADAVRVMAGRTGRFLIHDMLAVLEAGVVQQGGAAVAFIAEGIAGGGLRRVVIGGIAVGQKVLKIRAMEPGGRHLITVAVAIRTADDAGDGKGRQQAGDIRIFSLGHHRMERRVGRIELSPRIEIIELTGNGRRADDIVVDVAMAFETYLVKILG